MTSLSYILLFFTTILLIYFIKSHAEKFGLIDIPNGRSSHNNHTPKGAGIGFFLAVVFISPFLYSSILKEYIWVFLAIFLVFIVGILDDRHDVSPKSKFVVIIIATFLLYMNDMYISQLGMYFGYEINLGWFALPFTIFAVVGFTNALNLIDGLDGLAATIGIIMLSAFCIIGYQNDDLFMLSLSSMFIVSLLAFLIFNWYPASIFMGDSGSLTLGFVIAVLAIKSLNYIPTASILLITAVPLLDTIIVMLRRKLKGKSMFAADRCHMHHILRHVFSENTPKTVLFLGALQSILTFFGLQLHKGIREEYILGLFLLNVIFLYRFLAQMIKKQKREC